MSKKTLYIQFLSISKKEQVLFKSFFNLAKFDFSWDFEILSAADPDLDARVSLFIVDEGHEWDSANSSPSSIPTIVVGGKEVGAHEQLAYLSRPIQWTEFKNCLANLDFSAVASPQVAAADQDVKIQESAIAEVESLDLDAVLADTPATGEKEASSQAVKEGPAASDAASSISNLVKDLHIGDDQTIEDESKVSFEEADAEVAFDDDAADNGTWAIKLDETESISLNSETQEQKPSVRIDLELDQLSSDYLSISQSEMVRVVDDVRQFYHEQPEDEDLPVEPVILITDEESSVASSVLILETDASEVWDSDELDSEIVADSIAVFEDQPVKKREGVPLRKDDVFWREANELIANNRPLLFVKPQRQMVYSRFSPGEWLKAYLESELSTLPLKSDWRPKIGLKHFPTSYLIWIDIMGRQNERLSRSIDTSSPYLLTQWPSFDLIYQNNDLLKAATRLFLRPTLLSKFVESVDPEQKRLITGFINACYKSKQLHKVDDTVLKKISKAESASFAKMAI